MLWAILAHLFWLTISYVLFRYRVEPIVLIKLLSSAPASQVEATNEVAKNTRWISAYFISLLLASFSIPTMIRSLISRFRLDRLASPLSSVFRFHEAPWYYLLTGADFSHEEAPDFIVVSAIVEVAKEAVLYVGVLDEFVVDSGGQLDRLVLQGVVRRPIENDKPMPGSDHTDDVDRFYKIDGDSFVLRYNEAITLNVQYVKLTAEGVIAGTASE